MKSACVGGLSIIPQHLVNVKRPKKMPFRLSTISKGSSVARSFIYHFHNRICLSWLSLQNLLYYKFVKLEHLR